LARHEREGKLRNELPKPGRAPAFEFSRPTA
jgi:hypothetical protein